MPKSDPGGAPTDSDGRLRLLVGLVMGVLIVLIIALVSYDFWNRRAQAIDSAFKRAANLTHILGQHLEGSFNAVDATLAHLAVQSRRLGGPVGNDGEWRTILQATGSSLANIGSISLVDAQGVVRHSTLPSIVGQSRADQFIFQALAQSRGDATLADAPFVGQRTGTVVIPLGRQLETANGEFAGLVVTTLVPAQLRAFYKTIDVGPRGLIRILHPTGVTVFQEPSETNPIGARVADDPVFAAIRTGVASGTLFVPGPDKQRLLTAYGVTGAAGLVISVALSEADVLARWGRDLINGAAVTFVLVLALLAAMLVLRRELIARRQAEDRLLRAQKMEAIGQLTGGIAHDFNNLLTVIVGCSDDLADTLPKDAPQQRAVAMITAASERAASLTRQLLAFARRQVLQPVSVDVNQLVNEMADLLKRTLGEEVEIEFALQADVLRVIVDPAQLESALLNLAINARDAMRGGGKLTIETANVTLDEGYTRQESDVRAGPYVMLAVSDTGVGMAPDVVARAFEPFFTTKGPGQGTGLGLSMVFGFVKQSGGHIKVYSEVGHGTTVKLYLPCRVAAGAVAVRAKTAERPRRGTESILAVEDDALVRDLVMRQLTDLGYTVIVARDGPTAMAELARTQRVDLLFTDVVLPGGMSGRDLATRARKLRPELRVLYTSGYTSNSIVHHGRLDPGVRLLQKPYARNDLAKAIRAALDEE